MRKRHLDCIYRINNKTYYINKKNIYIRNFEYIYYIKKNIISILIIWLRKTQYQYYLFDFIYYIKKDLTFYILNQMSNKNILSNILRNTTFCIFVEFEIFYKCGYFIIIIINYIISYYEYT